jgi:sugar O-acyltransferase (sialic acid O-acetyltransferase NeuD family)
MLLYGGGGHSKVVCSALEELSIDINGVFDDNVESINLSGINHLGPYDSKVLPDEKIILTVGNNSIRSRISNHVTHSFGICAAINSKIDKHTSIGEGTVILDGVVVQRDSKIGKHVILNTSSSVDHDCLIGNFVHLTPGARLAGGVHVGEGTFVGINASIIPNITIGKWCVIGAGAVIINDILDYSIVVGNPGRVIKYSNFEK